jgi:hypothetical protein
MQKPEDFFWDMFTLTGEAGYYLLYKEMQKSGKDI